MSRALDRLPCLLEDDEAVLHYFESLRWPADRLACFHCGGFGHVRSAGGKPPGPRWCYCEDWYYLEDREMPPFSRWRHASRLRRAAAKAAACSSPRELGADRIRLLVELSAAI